MQKLLVMFFVCGLTTHALAADNKKEIIGKWEAVQKSPKGEDIKILTEFFADGKFKVLVKEIKIEGKYTFVGEDAIETEYTFEGQTRKIKQEIKIDKDTLELKDPNGPLTKFTRKK